MEFIKNTKFQLNIYKIMPARPKNPGSRAVNITIVKIKRVHYSLLEPLSPQSLLEPLSPQSLLYILCLLYFQLKHSLSASSLGSMDSISIAQIRSQDKMYIKVFLQTLDSHGTNHYKCISVSISIKHCRSSVDLVS